MSEAKEEFYKHTRELSLPMADIVKSSKAWRYIKELEEQKKGLINFIELQLIYGIMKNEAIKIIKEFRDE